MARPSRGIDDDGMTRRGDLRKATASMRPLAAGQHVVVTAGVLRGRTGTLVRPARVVIDPGWMVRLDGRPLGLRRLRVATWALSAVDLRAPTR